MIINKQAWFSIFFILTAVAVVSWLAVITTPPENLRIISCDVGQGDAILIAKGDFQMLVDGGPNNKVVSCLGRYVPFWDRKIEIVVSTHPDADHYTGLVEVLRRYGVVNFLATEADKDNASYAELKKAVSEEGTNLYLLRSGNKIRYGDLYIDILSPSQPMFSEARPGVRVLGSMDIAEEESNSFSIVMHLNYGEFDALLTGDLTPDIGQELVSENKVPDVEYLQVPHHGSKNGLTEGFLEKASPEIAAISAGKNNRYGHPHPDIIKMLEGYKVLGTYDVGDVVVESDGKSWGLIH